MKLEKATIKNVDSEEIKEVLINETYRLLKCPRYDYVQYGERGEIIFSTPCNCGKWVRVDSKLSFMNKLFKFLKLA